MPDELVVAAFLITAGVIVFISPMPAWIRVLTSLAYIYIGVMYIIASTGMIDMSTRAITLRWGLIVLSGVVILSGLSWTLSGDKVWRAIKWK